MRARRWLLAVVLGVALAGAAGGGPRPAAVAVAASPNHAAVVVDTGTTVKRICVAFPEESISGEEALRRADAIEPLDPVFSDQYGSRGLAVCSLCGVGCGDPSDCFCDPGRYWAYYRAAPGASAYSYSSRGASASVVRDGDVEGWKWGKGEAPALTTVGKVCNIDEPPPRASSSGGVTTTSTTSAAADVPAAGPTTTGPVPSTTTAPAKARAAGPTTTGPTAAAEGSRGGPAAAVAAADPTDADAAALDTDAASLDGQAAAHARAQADARTRAADARADGRGGPSPVALAVFALLLLGLLGWRWRLRRAHPR